MISVHSLVRFRALALSEPVVAAQHRGGGAGLQLQGQRRLWTSFS